MAAVLRKISAWLAASAQDSFPLFSQLPPELQLEIWDQCFSGTHIHMLQAPSLSKTMHVAFDAQTREPVDLEEKFTPAWASAVPKHMFLQHFERASLPYSEDGPRTRQGSGFIVSWDRDLLCVADFVYPWLFRQVCLSPWVARVQRLALLISSWPAPQVEWHRHQLRLSLRTIRGHAQNALGRPEERQMKELMLVVRRYVNPKVEGLARLERDEFGFVDLAKAGSVLQGLERMVIARHCRQIQSVLVEELLCGRPTQLPKIRWVLDVGSKGIWG